MPLWIIYHPPSTFQDAESKRGLSKAITDIYTLSNLPAFYVNVLFQVIQADSFLIGGVARPSPESEADKPGPDSSKPFIRITVEHIALDSPTNPRHRASMLRRMDAALKPYIEDKGYDWEYSIVDTNRDLWKVQGLVPPMPNSEADLEWRKLNRPVPFEAEKGGLLPLPPKPAKKAKTAKL
ncbi:hypothetical protein NX059_009038 [Plenodomus lindquistii]|nr:hypothetical protein NX059_009038 [Plenodomus lindquistii]